MIIIVFCVEIYLKPLFDMKDYIQLLSVVSLVLQNYIARFGHGSAKLARQAQSKEKTLAKMVAGGLTDKVVKDRSLTFSFPECGKIPPPVNIFSIKY